MPFTLSHAAAALPFRKLRPLWSALVVGTFAPDFEYFLRISDEDHIGHHFPALLIFTLPSALIVLWLFETFVKKPAIELLPIGFQRRLQGAWEPFSFAGMRRFLAIVGWIALGIGTHLLWDSFTHTQSWFWNHWAWLRQMVSVPWREPVMMNKLMQAATSVLGIVAILIWLANWYRSTSPVDRAPIHELSFRQRAMIVPFIGILSLAGGYSLARWRLSQLDVAPYLNLWVITLVEAVTTLLSALLLLYGIGRTLTLNMSHSSADHGKKA